MTAAAIALCGCSNSQNPDSQSPSSSPTDVPPPLSGGGPALTQTSYDTKITSFDGTKIAATVFVPNAPANTPVPLIVHSHGWGARRMTSLDPKGIANLFYQPPEQAVKIANENGYYVISYSERGWGDSGGTDEVMSPAYEGKDFEAVLDWAEANLGPQLALRDGKLAVGLLGYSYGAAFQLMGASLDERVAVIVPALIGHSGFPPGLPTPQPQSAWGQLLQAGAIAGSAKLDPIYVQGSKESLQTGVFPQSLIDLTAANWPSAYCDFDVDPNPGQFVPHVPTFLVQGWNDTLFSVNEGLKNAQCLRDKGGADVHLLIQQYGHTLPGQLRIPKGDGVTGVAMQAQVDCGDGGNFNLAEAMYSFIDEHLRGVAASGPHVDVPQTCVTLDDNTGMTFDTIDAIPTGNTPYVVSATTVSGPNFIPLYTASAQKILLGIPHMAINVAVADSATPYAFFGIGIQRVGSSTATLLDDQIFPIHGTGDFDTDMLGVETVLNAGDVVGIMASNSSDQYAYPTPESETPATYTFSGTFSLPFLN